jgi:hypothetical protein
MASAVVLGIAARPTFLRASRSCRSALRASAARSRGPNSLLGGEDAARMGGPEAGACAVKRTVEPRAVARITAAAVAL